MLVYIPSHHSTPGEHSHVYLDSLLSSVVEYPGAIVVTNRTAVLRIERYTSSALPSAAADVPKLVPALFNVLVARRVAGAREESVNAEAEQQDLEDEDRDCGVIGESLATGVSVLNCEMKARSSYALFWRRGRRIVSVGRSLASLRGSLPTGKCMSLKYLCWEHESL